MEGENRSRGPLGIILPQLIPLRNHFPRPPGQVPRPEPGWGIANPKIRPSLIYTHLPMDHHLPKSPERSTQMKGVFIASLSGIIFILWVLPHIKVRLLIEDARNRYRSYFGYRT